MNVQWQDFLKTKNALFTDQGDTLFGKSHTDENCWKTDLSMLGILKISGADKQSFLQGQLTGDTRDINSEKAQFSSYCTPKGRMLANMRIAEQGDNWLIVLPLSRLASIQKRLQMFVMRSDVTIEDASSDFACIGISGDCTEQITTDNTIPKALNDAANIESGLLIKVDESPRFLLIATTEQATAAWQSLNIEAVDSSAWRLADIRAAIPTVYEETVEAFIPQMTNMQLLSGVSFTKGCYTGQEVVARMQYLGKLKRRMYPVSFSSDQDFSRGADIFSAESQSGQGAGKLVDVVKTSGNQYEALAVVEIASHEAGNLHVGDIEGPALQVKEPPYPFEVDE